MKNYLRILLVAAVCFFSGCGEKTHESLKPSELVGPCQVIQLERLLDDTYPVSFTILDSRNQVVYVDYYNFRLSIGNRRFEPGGREEQVVFDILKKAFAQTYDSEIEWDPDFPEIPGKREKCYQQEYLEYALIVLQQRCELKRGIKRDEAVFPFKWSESEWRKRGLLPPVNP